MIRYENLKKCVATKQNWVHWSIVDLVRDTALDHDCSYNLFCYNWGSYYTDYADNCLDPVLNYNLGRQIGFIAKILTIIMPKVSLLRKMRGPRYRGGCVDLPSPFMVKASIERKTDVLTIAADGGILLMTV